MTLELHTGIQIAVHFAYLLSWLGFSRLTGTALLAVLGRLDGRAALTVPNPELLLFLSICAGIAIQIPILIGLALTGVLKTAFITTAALLLLGCATLMKDSQMVYWPITASPKVSITQFWLDSLPLILLIIVWVLRPLGPSMGHDDISYHLPYARFYLEQGGLAVNEFVRFPLHTHSYNLLYSVALLRDGTTMAQWVHAASGLLVIIGTWGLARYWFGWLAAVGASVFLLFLDVFREALGTAFVDLGLTLFFTASVVALVMWEQSHRQAWLWLSGVFVGTMLGIKYLALVLSGLLGLVVVWVTRNLRQVLVFSGIAALLGCFWYVRSFLISGNPFHPFASEIFGHFIWTEADIGSQWGELGRHGIDKTPLNFVMLPWQLLTNADAFHESPGLVGWLVGLFFVSFLRFRFWSPLLQALSLSGLAYLVFWFSSSQVMRYMMPITPVLALAVASMLMMLVKVLRKNVFAWSADEERGGETIFSWLGQLLIIIPVAIFCWRSFNDDLARLPLSDEAQIRFMTEHRPGYELYQVAGSNPVIAKGALLQMRVEADRFFYAGELYGDWFGHYPYRELITPDESGELVPKSPAFFFELLRKNDIRGLVLSKQGGKMFYPKYLTEFELCFDIIFSNRYGDILVPKSDGVCK